MPRCQEAMKDVASCDKPRGAATGFDPWISEWDNPAALIGGYRWMNSESSEERRGEVKHLSNPRKRKRSDSVNSGERKRNSPNQGNLFPWGSGTLMWQAAS